MTVSEAQKYAKILGRIYHKKCWSVEAEDIEAAALGGYVLAMERFKPPGDVYKYARAYMRGAALETLRQEARAHGLVRPHTRRCKKCREPLAHKDKLHHRTRYCKKCGPIVTKEKHYERCTRRKINLRGVRLCRRCKDFLPKQHGLIVCCLRCRPLEAHERKLAKQRLFRERHRERLAAAARLRRQQRTTGRLVQ